MEEGVHGEGGVFEVVGSVIDWSDGKGDVPEYGEDFFPGLAGDGGTEFHSFTVLELKDDYVCPVEQEFLGSEFLCFELGLESQTTLSIDDVFHVLVDVLQSSHALRTTLEGRLIDLLIKCLEILHSQDDTT